MCHKMRETAADVIAELAAMADPAVLKPYLIKTSGPLIRVVGDRFPSNVKAAILQVPGFVSITSVTSITSITVLLIIPVRYVMRLYRPLTLTPT